MLLLPSHSSPYPPPMCAAATNSRERGEAMFEYVATGIISLALTIYLVYALLRPERF